MAWKLNPDRYFTPEKKQRKLARSLYEAVSDLPIVSPHGHVDPKLFSNPSATLGNPTELLIIPDHYVFRMLFSQGIGLEKLGVPRSDGGVTEQDPRKIWQVFCDHYYLFSGTPSGGWIDHELIEVLGISEKPNSSNAQGLYDQINERLHSAAFQPRQLLKQLNIEILCTTDAATDKLSEIQQMRADQVLSVFPTFRPDAVVNIDTENWQQNIQKLSEVSGIAVGDYSHFLQALEQRRYYFKQMGAHATDHAALTAYTERLSEVEAEAIFQRALLGKASVEDAYRFTGHMLIEMARMSIEDGLVMQLHVGSFRNHSEQIFRQFGRDKGMDIPAAVEFTRSLRPLLNLYGTDPRLSLLLFTVDEDVYSRELAPLAGAYPSIKLGPPWWFHDSPNGMLRYFDQVMETAGIFNTAGFNDDTRAFLSIPARHDVWRRVSCDWLAGMVLRGRLDSGDAENLAYELTYGLAKRAYHFD